MSIDKLKLYRQEILVAKNDYDDLLSPFADDKNSELIEKQKNRKLKKILKLYEKKDKEIEKVKDCELRVILTYVMQGWSIRKIAKEMHYSKSAIWKKIKKYKGEQNENSRPND